MESFAAERSSRRRFLGAVAVVVIIAAVAALAGALLVGDSDDGPPSAEFTHEYDDGVVTVTHAGGDTFTTENTARLQLSAPESSTTWAAEESDFPVAEGDSARLGGVRPGDTVRVVWIGHESEMAVRTVARLKIETETTDG